MIQAEWDRGISRKNLAAVATGLGTWSALFLSTSLVVPALPLPLPLSRGLSAVLCLMGVFLVYRQLLQVQQNCWRWAASVAATGLLAYGFHQFGWSENARAFFHSLFLVLFAFCAGRALSMLVDRKSYLVPAGVVASMADLWSVYRGVSKQLVESESPVAQAVSHIVLVSVPVASGTGHEWQIEPIAGGTDFLFIAFFLGVSQKFSLSIDWSAAAMFIAMFLGLGLVGVLQHFDRSLAGLPGLPFLAGGYLVANWSAVRPGPREWKITLWFCAAAVLLLAVATWLSH